MLSNSACKRVYLLNASVGTPGILPDLWKHINVYQLRSATDKELPAKKPLPFSSNNFSI